MAVSVFISYSNQDRDFARRLVDALRERNADVWIDHAAIRVGDSLIERISAAISKADYLIPILSPRSIKSPWVQKELALGVTRELSDGKLRILPVLLESCEIPPSLADKAWTDFTYPVAFDNSMRRLLEAMNLGAMPVDGAPEWMVVDDGESATAYPFDYKRYIGLLRTGVTVGTGQTREEAFQDASNKRRGWAK